MFKSLLLKGRMMCILLLCTLSSLVVTAQTRITGKVIGSDDKQPVIGATVKIKGTNVGVVTDVNGTFALNANTGDVLVISYIGYQAKSVTITGASLGTISLDVTSSTLNEVVVTGYQTQVKKDITGAVATVNITDAKKIPATSSEQMLQGQASGVTVINQGAPGSASTVFVRGITNFGSATPLYVIDGVQTGSMSQVNPSDIESISVLKDAGSAAIYGISGGNGVIVVTTKKGKAGKTTLSYDGYYGDQVPLSGNVWNLMTPTQQMAVAKEASDPSGPSLYDPSGTGTYTLPVYGYHGGTPYKTFGSSGVTSDPSITGAYVFDAANPGNDFLVQKFNQAGTDWFHEIFKHAPQQSHTVTASGGNDKNTYLYSLQYLNQQGTLIETFEKRYQARINNTYAVLNNHVRFGESAYWFYRENSGGSPFNQQQEAGSISQTYRELPIVPVYDIAGHYGGAYAGPSGEPLGNGSNPVAQQQRTLNDRSRTWNMQGTAFAEADFMKYFTIRTAFGGNAGNTFYNFTGYNTYENYETHSSLNKYNEVAQYYFNYNWTNSIGYKETFGKHSISAFAAYELKQSGGQQLGVSAQQFVTLDPNFLTVAANTLPTSVNLSEGGNGTFLYQPTGTESFFGRADYSYNDRYLLGATIRRDGYSSFDSSRQWGTFPSISLGWRISQEDFLKSVSWINDLKLRGSYGSTGSNANIIGTNAIDTYNYGYGNTAYGIAGGLNATQTGYAQTSIGNPKTSWETDKVANIGIDASLFNHLDLNVEWYKKSISGLLFPLALPATTGAASPPTVNVGDVQNQGVDIAATYHDAIGQDFKFSVTANITSYKSKIVKLSSSDYFDLYSGSRIGAFVREQVGQPIGEFFGYQTKGIYQSDTQAASGATYGGAKAGSYIYQDVNGDGKITTDDRTFIGNPNPDFTYGVNINASYKAFDFTMVLYGSHGNKDFNYVHYWTDFYNSFTGGKDIALFNNSAHVDPATRTVTNPSATQTSVGFAQPLGSSAPSSFYVEDGSFLKCRVAQLGYSFDPGMLKSAGITKLHVYFQATNLFTITKYTGLDPELVPSVSNLNQGGATPQQSASTGVDFGAYPNNQKAYIIGVNMTF